MRVRKRPWASQVLQENSLVINDAPEKKGKWREYFGNDNPIYVEIGCGKGGFLRKNAETYPDVNFIGIERQETVVAMAAAPTPNPITATNSRSRAMFTKVEKIR